MFVVNQDKSVSGINDPGVALLNLYNFAKLDRNSAAKALDLVIKAGYILQNLNYTEFRQLKMQEPS